MPAYREHIISYGDTLHLIAQKHYRDISRWTEIAEFNNLRYPYIVDTSEEKLESPKSLLTIGDKLLIKVEEDRIELEDVEDRLSVLDKEEIYGLALGKDLNVTSFTNRLESRGGGDELLELSASPSGDLEILSGLYNLKQSLIQRLMTARGSYLGHDNYGTTVQKYIGRYNNIETANLVSTEVERTLRSDGRVSNVEIVSQEIAHNTYEGRFRVTPISFEEGFDLVVNTNGPVVIVEDQI